MSDVAVRVSRNRLRQCRPGAVPLGDRAGTESAMNTTPSGERKQAALRKGEPPAGESLFLDYAL
jgi:hypothetical protein